MPFVGGLQKGGLSALHLCPWWESRYRLGGTHTNVAHSGASCFGCQILCADKRGRFPKQVAGWARCVKPDRGPSLLQDAQPARLSEALDPRAFSRNGTPETGGTTVPLVSSQQGPCCDERRIRRLTPAGQGPFARPPRLGLGSLCASGHPSSGCGWLGIDGAPPPCWLSTPLAKMGLSRAPLRPGDSRPPWHLAGRAASFQGLIWAGMERASGSWQSLIPFGGCRAKGRETSASPSPPGPSLLPFTLPSIPFFPKASFSAPSRSSRRWLGVLAFVALRGQWVAGLCVVSEAAKGSVVAPTHTQTHTHIYHTFFTSMAVWLMHTDSFIQFQSCPSPKQADSWVLSPCGDWPKPLIVVVT